MQSDSPDFDFSCAWTDFAANSFDGSGDPSSDSINVPADCSVLFRLGT
jgi:hypothetical protein